MQTFLAAILCLLSFSCALAESFISPSLRTGFNREEIPKAWIPDSIPAKGNEMKAFLDLNESKEFQAKGLLISHLIELCGMPSTYMVTRNSKADISNYLVYDLPSGEIIVLYVSAPSVKYFGAAAAYDSKGKLLRLIK